MTMLICRLGDPLKSCGRENLNFSTLADFYKNDSQLQQLVRDFRDSCAGIKAHRNKLVAHSDLQTRLKPNENLLPPVGRSDVETIIERARKVLKHVMKAQADKDIEFDVNTVMGSGALIFWLKKGWESQRGPRG